jgi:hypothetical protein
VSSKHKNYLRAVSSVVNIDGLMNTKSIILYMLILCVFYGGQQADSFRSIIRNKFINYVNQPRTCITIYVAILSSINTINSFPLE